MDDLLTTARAYEAVNCQLNAMSAVSTPSQVNHIHEEKASNQKQSHRAKGRSGHKKECYKCGRQGHFARDKQCPAKSRKCRHCGEIGHFEIKGPKKGDSPRKQGTSHHKPRNNSRTGRKENNSNTNYVNVEDDEAEEPDYVFSVGADASKADYGSITLTVGGVDCQIS